MHKKKDLVNVIASRAAAYDFFSFFNYLPNPDPVLKKMGKDISVYHEMLSDAHVGGCVRRRKAAVKSLEWRITPTNNPQIDKRLNAIFAALPLSQIISQILDACLFGYQVLEVIWIQKDGIWQPQKIDGKPQEWFIFDNDNNLKLKTKNNSIDGIPLPAKKFLLATQDATYTNPYGKSDLGMCFWAATFKKGGLKFWLEFTEKYGAPWLVGKHPRRAKHNEIDELLDSMEQMIGTAVAAIPDDSSIEFKESASKGASSQVFNDFLKYCKSEISIALLGQNQTTEQESNRASASAGLEVLEDIREDDKTIVQSVFNTLLQWICELNFNVPQLPQFELFEQESIDKLQAERDEILSHIGVKFTKQYIKRTYNFEDGDIEMGDIEKGNIETGATKSTVFNERNYAKAHKTKHNADLILEQLELEAEPYIEQWLQDIQDKLTSAESLEDFRNQLDSLIPDLSFSEYAKVLAWASTSAVFAGREAVDSEIKAKQKNR